MRYLIGGPPRVGKTLLGKKISEKLKIPCISTDVLRAAAMELDQLPKTSGLFAKVNAGEWDDHENYYMNRDKNLILQDFQAEAQDVVKLAHGYIKEMCARDEKGFLVEGDALYPHLVDLELIKRYQIKYFCLGNTNANTFFEYAWKYRTPGDWMGNFSPELFKKVLTFYSELSQTFKHQAEENHIPYFELSSETFLDDVEAIIKSVTEKEIT